MKLECHILLGHYLAKRYMPTAPKSHIAAFLLGCQTPDRNPTTYLKGSLRSQWLKGHNYENALRYIRRLSFRIQRHSLRSIEDYYNLGKLIHYTADAFTYCHNRHFHGGLKAHRHYEKLMEPVFRNLLSHPPSEAVPWRASAISTILYNHAEYATLPPNAKTDSAYIISVCRAVMVLAVCNRNNAVYSMSSSDKI